MLDIVRHDRAAWRAVRPEPDEGHLVKTLGLHRQREQPLETLFDGAIDRPPWKLNVLPVAQVRALNMTSNGNRQERPQCVVNSPCHRAATHRASLLIGLRPVAFVAETLD